MSETLVFVFVAALGCIGIIVGLLLLLLETRNASASSWDPRIFSRHHVMEFHSSAHTKRVPSTAPVRIRRIWVKPIQEDEKKPTVLRVDEQ